MENALLVSGPFHGQTATVEPHIQLVIMPTGARYIRRAIGVFEFVDGVPAATVQPAAPAPVPEPHRWSKKTRPNPFPRLQP